ncbi:phosphotransferase family protein [Yinghuangia seranimata]|uniref:phosphotransferase family protein n=1 Tax=Yinghuangia seranimata TaxID=408067 RepID=UPI00248C27CC|nr:phosphotransferase family protein [Yinghuangia seranimata]MDI2128114.1 phosphotransferase family protein [Yinghuangia seranimata]
MKDPADPVRLAAWARDAGLLGAGDLTVTRLSGGASNLTYRVTGGGHDWVLRRPPAFGALPTAHDMAREFRVQAALAGSGVPVAAMVALCGDPGVLGAPFYLMERLDGVFHTRSADVAALAPTVAREAGLALARALGTLHAVPPSAVGLGDLARPEPYLERQLRRWRGQWDRVGFDEVPELDRLLRELGDAVPASGRLGIVHGDYNLGNVMYRADDPARVRAVLDWELSAVGDPLADVGQLLAYWGAAGRLLNAHRGGHLPDANAALPGRDELVEAYVETTGAPLPDLAFYERFAVVKLAVICAGSLARAAAPDRERVERTVGLVARLAAIADATG